MDRDPAARPPWSADLPDSILRPSQAIRAEIERVAPRRRFDLAMGPIWDLPPAATLAEGRVPTVISLHTSYALARPFKPEWAADTAFRAGHVDPVIAGEKAMLQRARHALANSRALVRDLVAAYGLPELRERAVVIPHGLPDRAGAVGAPRRGAHDPVEILFVGRLEPRKGADVLLDIAPRLLGEAPDARLTVAGDDRIEVAGQRLRERFERRWAGAPFLDRIRFTGLADQAELLRLYAGCDLFVAPSRYESFGLVFLEAMMFAKPCIGCEAGGIGEVVTHGETGLLVPPGNGEALLQALLDLVRHPERRAAMGRAGRRRYDASFTLDAMVELSERFFEDVKRRAAVADGAAG